MFPDRTKRQKRGTLARLSQPPSPPPSDDSEAFGGPGGSAVFNGAHYQTEVATYIAAVGLADQPQQLGDAFPAGAPLRIGAEQHWPIDDIVVWFADAIAWIQAKRDLDLDDLRDAFAQFVAQRAYGRGRECAAEPIRPDDRFILAFARAPRWAREMDDVLARIRDGERLDDEITQGSEPAKDAYEKLVDAARGADPTLTDADIIDLLTHVWLFPLDSTALETAARSAMHFVVDKDDIIGATSIVFKTLHATAKQRSVRDIGALRIALAKACALLAPPSVRNDVERLIKETDLALASTDDAGFINAADGHVHLDRVAVDAAIAALEVGNVIITGPAGEGKSVVLRDAAKRLRSGGVHVIFLEADGESLALEHSLSQIFVQWAEPGRLFIDGFDSARLGAAADTLRRVISRLRGTAWHVAIAGRDYDIERDAELRTLFPVGPPIPEAFRDDRFSDRAAILRIGPLTTPEVDDLRAKSHALDELFASAPPTLAELLHNPFNLSIAADLHDIDLRSIASRTELLDTWWEHRIAIGSSDAEPALRALLREMIARRSLFVDIAVLDAFGAARHDLLSHGVLVRRGTSGAQMGFRHAAIFEYAVERLLLTGAETVAALLAQDRDAFVFILPSLRSYFTAVFQQSPADFIAQVDHLFSDGRGRATLLALLAHIPAMYFTDATDLAPLFDGTPTRRDLLRHIISAARYLSKHGYPLVGEGARPFAELTLLAAERIADYPQDAPWLLEEVSKGPLMSAQGKLLARAARLAVIAHLARDAGDVNFSWFALIGLPAFIRTIDFDPEPAHLLLQRLVAPERLGTVGQHEVHPLTKDVDQLTDTRSLDILYTGLFADIALPAGSTGPGRPSVGINLSMDNKQILGSARDALARRLAAFFPSAPREATRALCAIVRSNRKTRLHHAFVDMTMGAVQLKLVADGSNLWESGTFSDYDPWKVALKAFEAHLAAELDLPHSDFFAIALDEIANNGADMLLWRALIRNAGKSAAAARLLLPLLLQSSAFRQAELEGPIKAFLRKAYATLTTAERDRLDDALIAVEEDADESVRKYRRKLVESFVKAIPLGVSTKLESYRPVNPGADDDDDVDEAHFIDEDEVDVLDDATSFVNGDQTSAAGTADAVAIDASAELQALRESIGDGATASVDQLLQVSKSVRNGLAKRALSDDALRSAVPALLAAAACERSFTVSDDGIATDFAAGELVRHVASTIPWVYQRLQDPQLADTMDHLAAHPDMYVRATILQHVMLLGPANNDLRWKIVEDALTEQSYRVLAMAGDVLLEQLIHIDAARATRDWFIVYDRFATDVVHDFTIAASRGLVTLAVAGDAGAVERLDKTLENPWATPELARLLQFAIVTSLAPRSGTETAATLLPRLVAFIRRLRKQLEGAIAEYGYDYAKYPAGEVERTKLSIELLSEFAHRLQVHLDLENAARDSADVEKSRKHFGVLLPLFEELAPVQVAQIGYYLVQALETAIELNPRGVLLLAIRAVLTAAKSGLASDHFGQEKVLSFLLRYISDYRELIVNDHEVFTAVMDLVDVFADVGWQEWIDIAIALDALYREE